VVSRLIERERYWEVMAPITLDGAAAGAVACRFSLERPDRLASGHARGPWPSRPPRSW
jgi:hypothetical protein